MRLEGQGGYAVAFDNRVGAGYALVIWPSAGGLWSLPLSSKRPMLVERLTLL